MEGQGHRDRYGNPIRQPSQSYPQGYNNVASQNFQGSYTQSRTQGQMGAQAPSYGPGQTSAQRPGSQGFAYNQSLPQFQSLPGQQIQYGGDFGTDPSRQSYPQIMGYYNQSQTGYDQLSSYQRSQQHIQPQPFPDYYPEGSYTAAPQTPSQLQHYPQTAYGQRQARTSNTSPYTPISAGYPGFDQNQMQPPSMPQQQASEPTRPNDGYEVYFRKLRETYDHIQAGRLTPGGSSLLEASDALLTRVEELGLTRDDENVHEQRLKMWKDFNLCWLAFMQKLKDSLDAVVHTGQQPARPQTLITPAFLDKMADKLIAWADSVERWGLVDYETGVWEEEILEVAGDCRTVFEANPDTFSTLATQQRPP